MYPEPGLYPTTRLRMLISQRVAAPETTVSVRAEGDDAGLMTRGKVLELDRDDDGHWKTVGWVVAGFNGGPSEWHPVSDGARFGVTLEGYSGTTPLVFQVPPVGAGKYRIRLGFINGREGSVRERTATLYSFLRVLDSGQPRT